jgi:predicted methyltransferase
LYSALKAEAGDNRIYKLLPTKPGTVPILTTETVQVHLQLEGRAAAIKRLVSDQIIIYS